MEIDTSVLREHFGPNGPWATEAGLKIKDRLGTCGMSEERLAADVGVTLTTVRSIEAGRLVPRDYLRAAIAAVLRLDVADIWPPPRCERVRTMALTVVGS